MVVTIAPDLHAHQRAEQHADGDAVEDEAVDGVLEDRRVGGGEDDLQDVGADGGEGGDAQAVDEHGEGEEPAAHAHDRGDEADDEPADDDGVDGDGAAAGDDVLVEADARAQRQPLQPAGEGGGRLGRRAVVPLAPRATPVGDGVEAQDPEHDHVDQADHRVAESAGLCAKMARLTVPPAVTPTSEPTTNQAASRTLTLPSLRWIVGAHDRLGEQVELVGADGHDAADAEAHERGREDVPAARADDAGDQPGDEADQDRAEEHAGVDEWRA